MKYFLYEDRNIWDVVVFLIVVVVVDEVEKRKKKVRFVCELFIDLFICC